MKRYLCMEENYLKVYVQLHEVTCIMSGLTKHDKVNNLINTSGYWLAVKMQLYANKIRKAGLRQCIQKGGIQLIVEFSTCCHFGISRKVIILRLINNTLTGEYIKGWNQEDDNSSCQPMSRDWQRTVKFQSPGSNSQQRHWVAELGTREMAKKLKLLKAKNICRKWGEENFCSSLQEKKKPEWQLEANELL